MILTDKLPFIIAILSSVIVGIISYLNGAKTGNVYFRMLLSFGLFYLLGLYLKTEINKVIGAVNEKKQENENDEELVEKDKNKSQIIDYLIGKDEDVIDNESEAEDVKKDESDFVPLKISQVIRSTVKDD